MELVHPEALIKKAVDYLRAVGPNYLNIKFNLFFRS